MGRYLVTSHITHDHSGYAPGEVIDLPADAASVLLDLGHIAPGDQVVGPVDAPAIKDPTEATEAASIPESVGPDRPLTGGDSEEPTPRRTRKPKA